MDRALDPDRIRRALGSPDRLPSATELATLLADAEVSLFLRRPNIVDDQLLATGWYLHGMASATAAADRYPLERRRAAFRVAAHIFDLALEQAMTVAQPPVLPSLRYAFAAQVGYIRSELTPNSMAMSRRLGRLGEDIQLLADAPPSDGAAGDVDEAALSLGCALLGFRRGRAYSLLRSIRDQLTTLHSLLGRPPNQGLNGTRFGVLPPLEQGCRSLLRYLLHGDVQDIGRADLRFRAAMRETAGQEHLDARWVAAHLREIAEGMADSSVWTALPPDTPDGVRRAFTAGDPPVLSLWPPQQEMIRVDDNGSPLDADARRIVLTVPTSAGKTLISHMFSMTHLARRAGGVCYVVPTRSLGREVRRGIRQRLNLVDFGSVAPYSPDFEGLEEQPVERDMVSVVTPERLANLIRTDAKGLLDRYSLFIVDEAHSLGDATRGFTLESSIAMLHWLTADTAHRIVLMSAAIGNRSQVRTWLSDREAAQLRESEWRGPRRLHGILTTEPRWAEKRTHSRPNARKWKSVETTPKYLRVQLRLAATGEHRALESTRPVGKLDFHLDDAGNPKKERRNGRWVQTKAPSSTTFNAELVPILKLIGESGPVLVIRSTRQETTQMANALRRELADRPECRPLADLVSDRLSSDHPLTKAVSKGVAFHNAALPSDVQDAIEEGARTGLIRYVIATTTLTEGVNLPVRTVVIVESDGEWSRQLTGSEIINAVGRAGRACVESEGWALFAPNRQTRVADSRRLDPTDDEISVSSSLTSHEALDQLADFESELRESFDAVFSVAANTLSDFISFAWLVLTASEELHDLSQQSDDLEAALKSTLAWQQLSPEHRRRWLDLAHATGRAYHHSPAGRRRRWGRVALSVGTARSIDVLSGAVASAASNRDDLADPYAALELLHSLDVLSMLAERPESHRPEIYDLRTGKNRKVVEVDVLGFLTSWIRGVDINELGALFLEDVGNAEYRAEQVGRLREWIEHYLSWSIATVVEWANESMPEQPFPTGAVCRELGQYLRYGVDNTAALRLLHEGIGSRRLAVEIVRQAPADTLASFTQLREWLIELGVGQFRERFGASASDLRDLLSLISATEVRLAGQVLAGQEVQVVFNPSLHASEGVAALAPLDEDLSVAEIAVERDGIQLGQIPSTLQGEVSVLLATGLPLRVAARANDGWHLLVSLGDV